MIQFIILSLSLGTFLSPPTLAFTTKNVFVLPPPSHVNKKGHTSYWTRNFLFDKIFEEEGILGKGVTVGKVQVALTVVDRTSDSSICNLLEGHAADESDANEDLARMANDICLALMRKSDDWVAACSTSKWFSSKDAGKAESYYTGLANTEATKFEKVRKNKKMKFKILKDDRGTYILYLRDESTDFSSIVYRASLVDM